MFEKIKELVYQKVNAESVTGINIRSPDWSPYPIVIITLADGREIQFYYIKKRSVLRKRY